jgi:hypothetical protein
MFQIAIVPNNTDANMSLSYKTKDAAMKANDTLYDAKRAKQDFLIFDDFGYGLSMNGGDISYALFVDLEESQVCVHEKNLAIARSGRKLGERVNDSPEEKDLLGVGQPSTKPRLIQ